MPSEQKSEKGAQRRRSSQREKLVGKRKKPEHRGHCPCLEPSSTFSVLQTQTNTCVGVSLSPYSRVGYLVAADFSLPTLTQPCHLAAFLTCSLIYCIAFSALSFREHFQLFLLLTCLSLGCSKSWPRGKNVDTSSLRLGTRDPRKCCEWGEGEGGRQPVRVWAGY